MGVISIVNGDYKPTYNWGYHIVELSKTTRDHALTECTAGSIGRTSVGCRPVTYAWPVHIPCSWWSAKSSSMARPSPIWTKMCMCVCLFIHLYIYIYIWVNYNISLTWIVRPWLEMISLTFTMIPGFGRSEVVMKFTQIYMYLYIYTCI